MGTAEFAVPSLRTLVKSGYDICTVATAPDKPRGRGQKLLPTPVKSLALELHLSLLQPVSPGDPEFFRLLQNIGPDLIVVVAFRILPREIFTLAPRGSLNLHASLLPRYRGAAPIQRALMAGERETGVTTFFLAESVDTGSILLQARMAIHEEDDAGTLHDRLADLGADVVLKTVRLIEEGKAIAKPQDSSLASSAPKIFKDDCLIRWNRPALEIRNQIRALSPSPGAFTTHADKLIKLYRASVVPGEREPGTIEVRGNTLTIGTGDGLLSVELIQHEGRKMMGVGEFLRGYPVRTGDRFN